MNGYEIFLIIEVARNFDILDKFLEYDLTWTKGEQLYEEFKNSTYNVIKTSELDAMVDFIYNKKITDVKSTQ